MLDGRVAIVTGGRRGLGEGVVRRFAAEGATVVVADLAPAESLLDELTPSGGEHRSVAVDVRSAEQMDGLVQDTLSWYGRLDIVVNNAGVMDSGAEVADLTDAEYDLVLDVNVRGVFNGCRAAARVFRGQPRGRIINTASYIGKKAIAGHALYSASKAAVISLTQALALELGRYGTTVNSICPGTMYTPMWVEKLPTFVGEENPDVEQWRHRAAAGIPAGRMGTGADVGAMAAWLAGDDADFVTGAALNLTGGEAVFF
ncbi:SDR family oxidoreductase [Acrocarpospora pleiomorpha]|uniref:SDR family oxidoreductase n=1 Tax=Acrocarpospora pleiomorpha TaxID=90975 RepID=A0A5M3XGH0_9ACTN|nr:SDR family NAD(P)-dependent oxidoreductase [Acrocarpospora pleiomorpha]GES17208.1 SDR family oxidoreductase [Acrocarpospora pleiomorpha]